MKTISMEYKEYEEELALEREKGAADAFNRIMTAIKEHKNGDDKEASLILIEDFGNKSIELCKFLGIQNE